MRVNEKIIGTIEVNGMYLYATHFSPKEKIHHINLKNIEGNQDKTCGYVYFKLHEEEIGEKWSFYIGQYVDINYRGLGLGNILMALYLYFCYENGYTSFKTCTTQRKLDILSVMNLFGFKVKNPEKYANGDSDKIIHNNKMVVDVMKKTNEHGVFFSFKTPEAEAIYRKLNEAIIGHLLILEPLPKGNIALFKKIGWVVPNERYFLGISELNPYPESLIKKTLKPFSTNSKNIF